MKKKKLEGKGQIRFKYLINFVKFPAASGAEYPSR